MHSCILYALTLPFFQLFAILTVCSRTFSRWMEHGVQRRCDPLEFRPQVEDVSKCRGRKVVKGRIAIYINTERAHKRAKSEEGREGARRAHTKERANHLSLFNFNTRFYPPTLLVDVAHHFICKRHDITLRPRVQRLHNRGRQPRRPEDDGSPLNPVATPVILQGVLKAFRQ